MDMLRLAFVVLATAALGGLSVATLSAVGMRFPRWFGSVHGLAGLAGTVALFFTCLLGGSATPALAWWAMGALLTALIGGLLLFRVLFPGKPPLALVALHASLALFGLWLLWRAAFAA